MTMLDHEKQITNALRVARMYYYQNMTTGAIGRELGVSRSTISRLLSFAKEQGLVEFRIHDPYGRAGWLEEQIQLKFGVREVKVVSVPEVAGEREWLQRVGIFAANYLNTLIQSNIVLGLAWGVTVSTIVNHLTPKSTVNVDVVQLNGAGNTQNLGITYASEIITRFAQNYEAHAHLFPVPTFFDYPETKAALWRERSIERILALQQRANVLLYSIGAIQAGVPSHVYSGGYLEPEDFVGLKEERVVGDIATVFFRADGSYQDIPMNARASGPDLCLFRQVDYALCVVSGYGKIEGLRAAMRGGYLTHLIVDEPTARLLLETEGT